MEQTIITFARCIKFFELAAFITGLLYCRKFKGSYIKYLIFYLGILVCGETVAYFLNEAKMYQPKNAMYDFIILPLEFLFFHWFYYQSFQKKERAVIQFCTALYVGSWLVEKLFLSEVKNVFMSLSYSIGNVTLLIIVFTYFRRLIMSEAILYFKEDIVFWISIGILIFYLGTFPYFGLRNILLIRYNTLFRNYTWVMIFLDYAMYILFSVGFVLHKPKYLVNESK